MTDAFEEVEESLRQDKAGELWKKYSPWLAAAAGLLILATGGYQVWLYVRGQAVETDARAFSKVMEQIDKKDFAAAKEGLTKLAAGQTGFAAMADHVLASVDLDTSKDIAAATKHLEAAAHRNDGVLSDIATLKLAYLKADTATLADLQATLAPLQKKGGPLGALSRELIAAKEAKTGDIEKARADYQALTIDIDAPQAMQQRVNQALALLQPRPAPAAAPPAPTTTTTAPAAPAPAASGKKPQ